MINRPPRPSTRLALALGLLFMAVSAAAAPPTALLEKYKCLSCHAEREALAGPAWVDVATHYRGATQAQSTVAAHIRTGIKGGGPWHMPPHPEISAIDAATIARYILALKE
jgi:cytochrome c